MGRSGGTWGGSAARGAPGSTTGSRLCTTTPPRRSGAGCVRSASPTWPGTATDRARRSDQLPDRPAHVEQVLRPAVGVGQRRGVRVDAEVVVEGGEHVLEVN